MRPKQSAEPKLEVVDLVRRVPLFEGLEESYITQLASIARYRSYRRDCVLFERGDEGEEFFVVVEGRLKVIFLNEDGRELTLTILAPYQSLGEISLIDDSPRSASAVALEDLLVLSIHKRDFRALLDANPRLAVGLLQQTCRRLRELTDDTAGLIFRDVFQRMARKLLNLAREIGVPVPGGREIRQRLTHQELANMVGSTRETATKVLNEMVERRLISMTHKQVTILDEAELESSTLHRPHEKS